jgi:1,4-alpha-glucan branching enzyme
MDFPRAGNNNSFAHARRQFNLVDDQILRYKYLNNFDVAMNWLEEEHGWLRAPQVSSKSASLKVGICLASKEPVCFSFSIVSVCHGITDVVHPTKSFTDYRVGVDKPGQYKVVLNSDEKRFGGHDRIDANGQYFTTPMEWNGRNNWLQVGSCGISANFEVYSPCRTVLVLGL